MVVESQVSRGGSECPVPGNIQGQSGQGPEQAAQCWAVGLDGL